MADDAVIGGRLHDAFTIAAEVCANLDAATDPAMLNMINALTLKVDAMNQKMDTMNQLQHAIQTRQLEIQNTQAMIQERQDQMHLRQTAIGAQLTEMDTRCNARFDGIEVMVGAMNWNATARTQNSVVGYANRPLMKLVNYKTGVDIEGFPPIAAQISQMRGNAVDRILAELGQDLGGLLPAKRDRLRVAIGLRLNAV